MQAKKIESADNAEVKRIKQLVCDKSARDEQGLFVAEGTKLCAELFSSEIPVQAIWYAERARDFALSLAKKRDCTAVEMSERVCEKLTDQTAPQGVFAIGKLPKSEINTLLQCRKIVLLSSVADPHNVGAIIRTAFALKYDGICLAGGCADAFSPKALRGSMGLAFHLPCAYSPKGTDAIAYFSHTGFACVAAALSEKSVPINELSVKSPFVLCIGNESRGLSPEEVALCTPAIIPMNEKADSLNAAVAASIFMWELSKNG